MPHQSDSDRRARLLRGTDLHASMCVYRIVSKHINNPHAAETRSVNNDCKNGKSGHSVVPHLQLTSQPLSTSTVRPTLTSKPCHITASLTLPMYNVPLAYLRRHHFPSRSNKSHRRLTCTSLSLLYSLIMPSSIILSTVSCSTCSSGVNFTPSSRTARLLSTGPTVTTSAAPSLYLLGRRRLG